MKHEDLPSRWKTKITHFLKEKESTQTEYLSAYDFFQDKKAVIDFEDGSTATFFYPLIIEAPDWQEVGVFTEHCGYFILNSHSVTITIAEV